LKRQSKQHIRWHSHLMFHKQYFYRYLWVFTSEENLERWPM
jgi:hypothetical protein